MLNLLGYKWIEANKNLSKLLISEYSKFVSDVSVNTLSV